MRPEFQNKLNRLEKFIKRKIGDPIAETNIEKFEVGIMPYEDAVFQEMKPAELKAEIPDQDGVPNPEERDKYIRMEVLLPRGYGFHRTTVAHIKRNVDVELIGLHNANPILDTRVYEAVLPHGEWFQLTENRVSESIPT